MALKDGWHRVPGDGKPESPDYRDVTPTYRSTVWVKTLDGKPTGALHGCSEYTPEQFNAEFVFSSGDAHFVVEREKAWGASMQDLLDPKPASASSTGLAQTAALVGGGFFVAALAKAALKTRTEKARRKLCEQTQVSK